MAYQLRLKRRGDEMIPTAHSLLIETCGDRACGHVHLIGEDMNGRAFCEIVVTAEQVVDMLNMLDGLAEQDLKH